MIGTFALNDLSKNAVFNFENFSRFQKLLKKHTFYISFYRYLIDENYTTRTNEGKQMSETF